MNYGYAMLPGDTPSLAVDPKLPEHLALQLYMRLAVALQSDGCLKLSGCEVLEIGSGRGGGAAHVARHFRPRRFVALDVSVEATALARRLHGADSGVEFVHGDAENLPFAKASFDVVINVESAHCYGSIDRFLAEVHRVLRPGGRRREKNAGWFWRCLWGRRTIPRRPGGGGGPRPPGGPGGRPAPAPRRAGAPAPKMSRRQRGSGTRSRSKRCGSGKYSLRRMM